MQMRSGGQSACAYSTDGLSARHPCAEPDQAVYSGEVAVPRWPSIIMSDDHQSSVPAFATGESDPAVRCSKDRSSVRGGAVDTLVGSDYLAHRVKAEIGEGRGDLPGGTGYGTDLAHIRFAQGPGNGRLGIKLRFCQC
jgi:hypothetical protein